MKSSPTLPVTFLSHTTMINYVVTPQQSTAVRATLLLQYRTHSSLPHPAPFKTREPVSVATVESAGLTPSLRHLYLSACLSPSGLIRLKVSGSSRRAGARDDSGMLSSPFRSVIEGCQCCAVSPVGKLWFCCLGLGLSCWGAVVPFSVPGSTVCFCVGSEHKDDGV